MPRLGQLLVLLIVGCRSAAIEERGPALDPLVTALASTWDAAEDAAHEVDPWGELARSVENRPLRSRTVGHGPRQVLWIGGIHGNEREGRVATAELPAAFLALPEAAERVTLTLVEDANPDGSAARRRTNAHGVDLNRNFPATNFRGGRSGGSEPLSQPEARALYDLIEQLEPDLVLVAHSWPDACFVNFDGPAREIGERFAATSGWPVRESGDLHATPGSLGSWVGVTLRRPILTLEYRRGTDPAAGWAETRAAILEAIVEE